MFDYVLFTVQFVVFFLKIFYFKKQIQMLIVYLYFFFFLQMNYLLE